MKLTKEQKLELENLDLKVKNNNLMINNLNTLSQQLTSQIDTLWNGYVDQARKDEDKPKDKFDVIWENGEIIFKEKEVGDGI